MTMTAVTRCPRNRVNSRSPGSLSVALTRAFGVGADDGNRTRILSLGNASARSIEPVERLGVPVRDPWCAAFWARCGHEPGFIEQSTVAAPPLGSWPQRRVHVAGRGGHVVRPGSQDLESCYLLGSKGRSSSRFGDAARVACPPASLRSSRLSTVTQATTHSLLAAAKAAKKDEFYTQWVDIEREMNAYVEYDPGVFRDKVILLPCDDPEWSNFTKFFALHFADFGIKKLISTSYAADSNPAGESYQPTLFEMADPKYDAAKTRAKGKKFTLEPEDLNDDGVIDIDDLRWDYLAGDGDFRSAEMVTLRDEADIVITNPPFSLFRPFVAWLVGGSKKFAIIGNQNAITYTEIFPLIRENRIWLGKGFPGNATHFESPYEDTATASDRREGMIRVSGVQWFTNIDHGRRHEPLQLMTMADNVKFSKHKEVRGVDYPQYDNFDAIEVPFTDAIPSDYNGLIGVPITYLNKHNPDQFEIIGSSEGDYPPTRTYGPKERVVDGVHMKSNTGTLACYIRAEAFGQGTYFDVGYPVRRIYKRLFIQRKDAS